MEVKREVTMARTPDDGLPAEHTGSSQLTSTVVGGCSTSGPGSNAMRCCVQSRPNHQALNERSLAGRLLQIYEMALKAADRADGETTPPENIEDNETVASEG